MTTQYTPILKIALPVTGELSGTWGDVVNDNITSMFEQAIAGLATISTWSANSHTLTTANGTTSESRCAMLVAADGAGLAAAGEIICPAASKLYVLKNGSSYALTLKTAGGTGVAVAAGETAFLFCDGTNVNACVTTIINGRITGNLTVDGNATINGNTTLGNATSDTITATARFASDLVPSTDNARDLGSSANSWRSLWIDGTATMALVAISGGTIDGVSIGATTPATIINVDNLSLNGNTISSTDTNGNIVLAPNGTGDVQLDADTVRVGDSGAAATLTSNGAGALTVTTGGAANLTLSTNNGTNSGTIVINNGATGTIAITPDTTGDVHLVTDTVRIGDPNTDAYLTTNGTGNLNLTTNEGNNSGTIQIAQGANGNITLTPNGTGLVSIPSMTLSGGTANGVAYLNGSKVLTTGSALTFDGSTLTNVNGAIRASGSTVPSSGAGLELLYGASGSGISTILSYSRTASTYQPLWIDASYQAYFISGSEQVRLNSTGFGIGTNAPSVKLQVEGAANSAPLTLLRLNNSGTTGGGPGIASRISFTAGATALGFIQGCNFASGEAGLQFSGDGTNVQATLNSIGSFGLGTTPNAWSSTVKAIQLGTGGSISNWTGSNGILSVASNMYDAGGGTQRYINTAAAARFDVNNGSFAWNVAGSGTAGDAITFAEAMALTATTPTVLRIKGSTSNNGGGAFYVTKAGSAGTHSAFGDAAAILGGTPDLVTTLWSDGNAPLTFHIGSERARFSTEGNLTVGGGGLGAAGDPRVSVISKSNYFWGSANGLGDFYIGDGTYGIAMGVATGGGGAGTSRIWAQNNGVANVLALGVANNDKLIIYPNQVLVQSAADATLTVSSIAGAFSSTLDLQSSSAGAGTINTSQYFRYTIAGTERARLTGSGDWLVGGTTVGATDSGSPQINLISAVTSTGQWTSRIVARNTGNDTSSFLGNYKDSTRSVAGVYAHNAPLSAWSTLYVNTTDGTYSGAGGNGGNVVLSGQVFVGKVAFNLSQNGCAFVNGDTTFTISAGNTLHVYDGPNGAYRFYVSSAGQINATSTTISGISDQRLKENIQDIDVGLAAVMALKPRKFDWKAGKGKGIKGDRGWIAQEFEQVFPDMIEPWKEEAPEGEEPYKAVRADLIPVLVKAIQEQQTIIESLKARLDAANL